MQEQLIYEINGIKYLLFSIPIVSTKMCKKLMDAVKKVEGIVQGAETEIHFWSGNIIHTKVLIPEKNAKAFSDGDWGITPHTSKD